MDNITVFLPLIMRTLPDHEQQNIECICLENIDIHESVIDHPALIGLWYRTWRKRGWPASYFLEVIRFGPLKVANHILMSRTQDTIKLLKNCRPNSLTDDLGYELQYVSHSPKKMDCALSLQYTNEGTLHIINELGETLPKSLTLDLCVAPLTFGQAKSVVIRVNMAIFEAFEKNVNFDPARLISLATLSPSLGK